jgi:hypothetical protein
MSYRIRITRPEHPQTLLRINRDEKYLVQSYQEVYRGREASEFDFVDFAKAIVQQLRDARHDSETSAAKIAWAFKVAILRFEPWKKYEPTAEEIEQGYLPMLDEETAPEDWERRMITGATLDILGGGHVFESYPFEIPADFDVATLAPLEYVHSKADPAQLQALVAKFRKQ